MIKSLLKKTPLFLIIYCIASILGIYFYSRYLVPPNFAIGGHDSGLPFDPRSFLLSRFFAWDPRVGFGVDNSTVFGSLSLHIVDYVSSIIGQTQFAGNWFNIFFWLAGMFFAATVFAYSISSIVGFSFAYLFPFLAVFNFYIFQSIFILERAKYSVYIATLLFLTICLRVIDKKISVLRGSILAALILFIFNSGSLFGLPLYGGFILILCVVLMFHINSIRLIKFLFLTGFFVIILNLYQIVPYIVGVSDIGYVSNLSTKAIVFSRDWVDYISQNTSLLNIFRLQAVPSWYSDVNIPNREHPYAAQYLFSPQYVFISFLFPILAFIGIVFAKGRKQKKLIVLFSFLALVSMIFAAGTHRPFGSLYAFIYSKLPGFVIFRTPYYKFASAYFISVSVLISFSLTYIISLLTKKSKVLSGLSVGLIVVIYLGFYHSLLFPAENNFIWKKGSSTRLEVPSYVYETNSWLTEHNKDRSRILVVPALNQADRSDGYTWGYWSLSPLSYSLSSQIFLANEGALLDEERAWVDLMHQSIKNKNEELFVKLAQKMNVGYVLMAQDSTSSEVSVYNDALRNFQGVKQSFESGKWKVYEIEGIVENEISVLKNPVLTSVADRYLSRELIHEFGDQVSFPMDSDELKGLFPLEIAKQECVSCLLERRSSVDRFPGVTVLPNSPLYKFKLQKELNELSNITDTNEKINFYLGRSLLKLSEFASLLSLGESDKDMAQSIDQINNYYNQLYEILSDTNTYSNNFTLQKSILDYLNFTSSYLGRYTEIEHFYARSGKVRDGILNVIWNTHKIKNLYPETMVDIKQWNYKKIYRLEFKEEGDYKLYFLKNTFHTNNDSQKFVLPSKINISSDDDNLDIELNENTKQVDRWYEVSIGNITKGTKELTMNFDGYPNVFKPVGLSKEEFPSGKRGCYTGSVTNFDSTKKYLIELELGEGNLDLSMYMRDPSKIYSLGNDFIQGEEKVDIGSDVTSFSYIYDPKTNPKNLNIFVCRPNESSPSVKGIVINEIFEPLVVSMLNTNDAKLSVPDISYEKINPTKFNVNIKNASGPFVIKFLNRFNSNWNIVNENKEQQVLVDSFANGWIVDKQGDFNLTIEYYPQYIFVIASGISLSFAILLLTILILYWPKKNND